LTTGYFPEQASETGPGTDFTKNVSVAITYDQLHVDAFLSWLDGKVPANSQGDLGGKVPTLFGGNFQVASVGEKTAGYVAGSLDFTAGLQSAIKFVDDSFGLIINKLKAKNLYDQTIIFVCSKHGQSPIDPTLFKEVDPANLTTLVGVNTSFITTDDVALFFLKNRADLSKAVANLQAHKTELRIDQIYYGDQQEDMGWGDATKDTAVPDIIVQPIKGTIYTTSKAKIAEHGGGSVDDRIVACFAHNPKLKKQTFSSQVFTTQVAPTVAKILGLDPQKLQGAKAEGTQPLPGFGGWGWGYSDD
jgi:Type I phosphodiesterase / nucleotide pyrophosphatase